jgi:hypothetical protein
VAKKEALLKDATAKNICNYSPPHLFLVRWWLKDESQVLRE